MKKEFAAAFLFTFLAAQVESALALPENEYACKVETRSQQTGVVLVQADDEPSASRIAASVNATRLDGVKEQVKTVLKCIDFPGQRFSDSRLQAFVEAMPR